MLFWSGDENAGNKLGRSCMKKAFLITIISLLSAVAVLPAPGSVAVVYAQKKDKDDRKNPAGPPVVRPKGGGQDKPKEPPPKKKRDG
jgi:hypothetical protein